METRIDMLKFTGYIGEKISSLETKTDFRINMFNGDNRKIIDVKIYRQATLNTFFLLSDGDIIATSMFKGL